MCNFSITLRLNFQRRCVYDFCYLGYKIYNYFIIIYIHSPPPPRFHKKEWFVWLSVWDNNIFKLIFFVTTICMLFFNFDTRYLWQCFRIITTLFLFNKMQLTWYSYNSSVYLFNFDCQFRNSMKCNLILIQICFVVIESYCFLLQIFVNYLKNCQHNWHHNYVLF